MGYMKAAASLVMHLTNTSHGIACKDRCMHMRELAVDCDHSHTLTQTLKG